MSDERVDERLRAKDELVSDDAAAAPGSGASDVSGQDEDGRPLTWAWALYWGLAALPLVATLAALFFVPDEIPAHWGADGVVNRWGSKWELLITPLVTLGFAALMTLVVRAVKGRGPKLTTLLTLLISLVSFCVLHALHIAAAFAAGASGDAPDIGDVSDIDVVGVSMVGLGVVLVVLGFVCLKLPPNPWMGVRIPGVAEIPGGWERMQRFGCATMVPAGILIAVVCLVGLHGAAALVFAMVVLVVLLAAVLAYGFWIMAHPGSGSAR